MNEWIYSYLSLSFTRNIYDDHCLELYVRKEGGTKGGNKKKNSKEIRLDLLKKNTCSNVFFSRFAQKLWHFIDYLLINYSNIFRPTRYPLVAFIMTNLQIRHSQNISQRVWQLIVCGTSTSVLSFWGNLDLWSFNKFYLVKRKLIMICCMNVCVCVCKCDILLIHK